jgi:hypothetical protein
MYCQTHAEIASSADCTGCAEAFCSNCLVTVKGAPYCASCKMMAFSGGELALAETPCLEATQALKYAVASFFFFGIIFGPVAISWAIAAKKKMAADPTLVGQGKATAAAILGTVAIFFWCIKMLVK